MQAAAAETTQKHTEFQDFRLPSDLFSSQLEFPSRLLTSGSQGGFVTCFHLCLSVSIRKILLLDRSKSWCKLLTLEWVTELQRSQFLHSWLAQKNITAITRWFLSVRTNPEGAETDVFCWFLVELTFPSHVFFIGLGFKLEICSFKKHRYSEVFSPWWVYVHDGFIFVVHCGNQEGKKRVSLKTSKPQQLFSAHSNI